MFGAPDDATATPSTTRYTVEALHPDTGESLNRFKFEVHTPSRKTNARYTTARNPTVGQQVQKTSNTMNHTYYNQMLGGYIQMTHESARVGLPVTSIEEPPQDTSISVTQQDASRYTCSSYETPPWLGRRYKRCLRPHLYDVTEHQQLERQRSFRLVLYRHLLRRSPESSYVDVQLILRFEQNGGQSGVGELQVDRRVTPRV